MSDPWFTLKVSNTVIAWLWFVFSLVFAYMFGSDIRYSKGLERRIRVLLMVGHVASALFAVNQLGTLWEIW